MTFLVCFVNCVCVNLVYFGDNQSHEFALNNIIKSFEMYEMDWIYNFIIAGDFEHNNSCVINP